MISLKNVALWTPLFLLSALSVWGQKDPKDLYLDKCSICHGQDGAGKTAKGRKVKAKDVRETVGKMSVEEMIKIVENGKGKDMDAFAKEFNKDQIKGMVDYYRGLAKK